VNKVQEGTKLVDKSGTVLEEIVTRVKNVTDVMAEIANLSGDQAAGIEQLNRAITAMDAMTQQNAALVEQAAAAAEALNQQATSLMKLIGHYRLS
jgi:methyl-accepting chemotaxis protein